jgi:pimeloyl-ACP methyl ester carboxylesterase
MDKIKTIEAGDLNVAYFETDKMDGTPVFLLHGFPYDIHAYKDVVPLLSTEGCRVIVPYLRGFGQTTFIKPKKLRSGEQAALGHDLLSLMNALKIPKAVLAGFDWGGRAACVVAALWPERCIGLLSCNSYNIQDIKNSTEPSLPSIEQKLWYQYYFHSERGRLGLFKNRYELISLLWKTWSPTWHFTKETYDLSAKSFENSDFVEVVIHSYRHRFNLVNGDPEYSMIENKLSQLPVINVPSITFDGEDDGVRPPSPEFTDSLKFKGFRQHRILPKVGHNVPQEAPKTFAKAVLKLCLIN